MNQMNSPRIQRTRKNSDQPRGERSSGFGRRSVEMRPAGLALQLPTLKPVKLHLLVCPLAVRLLLVSLFFVCSPFEDDTLSRQTSALAVDKEVTGRILPPVQAVLGEPLQPSQAVKIQTDDNYQAVFQRLGQDEYDLIDLVKCLGDFDPVELTGNFAESSDSLDSCFSADYQDETPTVKVKGNLKLNVAFWEHIGASRFIRDTILDGYKIPFIHTPPSAHFCNNRSAIQYSDFVGQAISDLLATGSVVECESAPTVVKPLSVSVQSNGKKRLILDLRHPNYFVMKSKVKFEDAKTMLFFLGFFLLTSNLVTII